MMKGRQADLQGPQFGRHHMFGRDLESASVVLGADTEQDVMDDDESLVFGRSGASDVSGVCQKHKRRSRKIPHPQSS